MYESHLFFSSYTCCRVGSHLYSTRSAWFASSPQGASEAGRGLYLIRESAQRIQISKLSPRIELRNELKNRATNRTTTNRSTNLATNRATTSRITNRAAGKAENRASDVWIELSIELWNELLTELIALQGHRSAYLCSSGKTGRLYSHMLSIGSPNSCLYIEAACKWESPLFNVVSLWYLPLWYDSLCLLSWWWGPCFQQDSRGSWVPV